MNKVLKVTSQTVKVTAGKILKFFKWLTILICAVIVAQFLATDWRVAHTVTKRDIETKKEIVREFKWSQQGARPLGITKAGTSPNRHSIGIGYGITGSTTIDYSKNYLSILGVEVNLGVGVLMQEDKVEPMFNIRLRF